MSDSPLFSESWHLVAGMRPALRPEVRLRRQTYRGRLWYVLGDPYTHRFFRITPEARAFLERLDGRLTVEQAWADAMADDPDAAPGQEEVLQVLAQLFQAGLLRSEQPLESLRLAQHGRKQRLQIVKSQLLNFLFLRIPLWDPDRALNALAPLWRWIVGPIGAIAWAAMVLVGFAHVIGRAGGWVAQTEGVLAPGNLAWLYVTWVVVKFFHELGHAVVCKRFGGEVHVMGVMLMVFTPFPYVDASAAWYFRERWKRVLTGAAGMIAEVFLAAIAAVIWANSSPGVVNQVAYNVMFLASVSTLLFNLNPLLRFDGYYMLSDWFDTPNLHGQSTRQLTYLVDRHAFGLARARPVARTPREGFWLAAFGLGSGGYRVFVLGLILLFLADRFFGLGLIISVLGLALWVLGPLGKFFVYVASSPKLVRVRKRAVGVTAGALAVLALLLFVLPFPRHFRAPGVVRADPAWEVLADTDGRVAEIVAEPGRPVHAGDLLVQLENRDLRLELRRIEGALAENQARRALALQRSPAFVRPLDERLATLAQRRAELEKLVQALEIRAPGDGVWSAPLLTQAKGLAVPRGTLLGRVVGPGQRRFVAVVSQEDAGELFGRDLRGAEARVAGEAAVELEGRDLRVIPAERRRLPTPALGWQAGGSVQVRADDQQGTTTVEPYFEVSFMLPATGGPDARVWHDRSGVARFALPAEPLGWQAWRSLRQLLQRRLGW